MSRFPAVAGRAPRRQEEGERSRDFQEERASAVSIVDREEKGCTSQEGGTTPTFPIQKQRKKLIQAVRDNSFLIVTGNTGSGKTTQLPKYLYEAGFSQHGMIGVTQPRKVAAISVAQRVAEEMKCALGSKVGYQVRFDDCSSKETAIKYMTDGCLLKHILGDPNLTKFSVIILDEAHERTLTTDILFGLLKKLFQEKSPNRKEHLKVVVMSATMELAKLSAFFGNCPIFDIPGRLYPVREKFCNLIGPRDRENTAYIQAIVKVTMDIHLNEMAGDILVFLTGQFEIEKSCELLFQMAESVDYDYDVQDTTLDGLLILPCYGSMTTDQQRRIFLPPPPGIRKCVISTNISATSLTIDGIRYVVDGGFVKQLNHNPRLGLDILEVVPISKSEALQRSGRAGRTSSGKCYRIYSKDFWNQCMPDHVIPEIKRTSLTSVVLTLKCLAIHDVIRFPYLDPPNERLILEALKQLYQCDAIDRSGHVTRLGLSMVEFPLPPHLTCAVIKAASLDCEDLLLPIAAMLSVENIFIRPVDPEYQKEAEQRHRELAAKAGGFNDFATLAVIFEQCRSSGAPASWCQKHWIHWRCLFSAFRVEAQLRELIRKLKQQSDFPRETFEGPKHEVLRRCLCAGYFKNVARRSVGRTFCTMDGRGSPVHIHPSSALHEQETKLEWIIFHEVLVTTKVYARIVCPIRYEWVRDLLPKLHEFNAHDLSSVARREAREDARRRWTNKENVKQLKDGISKEVLKKMQRRNDDKSISDARARFLERKQQRTQDHSDTLKETG
ncbi:PREDICTED: probable ATP-dependent RNA helicase DHX40 isoform X1 [Chrysochloris asiatica]|uniref:Probable ATP-dependent RNA helicase DHX40 n=1 Tax=Chrysochloris asiatica TaxID=185453 RepID=A0A9B0T5J0_CHRAS|nr:PREDICTED: probable ATP-dependent RNA helicase DHX40 isoform X1 [Chrysochloris asiatica]